MSTGAARYAATGVDIQAAEQAVDRIQASILATPRMQVVDLLGGYAGGVAAPELLRMERPVIVSSTDGVGTKLMLARELGRWDSVGIDLVAMCVNDIAACGARPVSFVDYLATGRLEPRQVEEVVAGVAEGCRRAKVPLVGGETAEMPGMYATGEIDLAGCAVGVADGARLLRAEHVRAGDVLVGLGSTGVHSNGFSLVRSVVAMHELRDSVSGIGELGAALLEPTRIYSPLVADLVQDGCIAAAAHVTGGGISGNVPRMLPVTLGAEFEWGSWPVPPIFELLAERAGIPLLALADVFNLGLGMVLACAKDRVDSVLARAEECMLPAAVVGHVAERSGVRFRGQRP